MTAAGPTHGEDLLGTCDKVLALVGDRAEAGVTVTSGRSGLTRFANSHIHQNVAESGQWARLKVVVDGRQATTSTSRLATGLNSLVERALEAAELRSPDPHWPGLAPPVPAPVPDPTRFDEATMLAAPDTRAEVVGSFVAEGPGLEAAGYCETGGWDVAFANSAGQRLWAPSSRAVVEGIHRTAGADGSGQQIAPRISEIDGAAAGRRAADKARRGDTAVEVEPGSWEVVLEPACVVDMLDFLTGQGFNAKHHAEGQSFVRLGETQFDPSVTIFDDANDPRALGYPFDAEGTPRRRLDLVRSGVSLALAYDRRTAALAGRKSTGHAVPGGEIAGPIPTNVFLEPGSRTPDDLIASVERGLLITEFWYTRILDPKTQVVTGLTRNGTFLIENGRVTSGVRNLRFTQSYAEALAPGNVLGIGNDGRLAGELQFFAPSVHLRSWNFTGGARG
ncbi:MAG: TldD/PmbA family protein [Acidimicrobiales bacterium]